MKKSQATLRLNEQVDRFAPKQITLPMQNKWQIVPTAPLSATRPIF